jgi:hypothetical protein
MRTASNTEKNIAPAIKCIAFWRLNKIKPLNNYRLEAEFIDGTHGFVEMKNLIKSEKAGIFAKLLDISLFNQVYLDYGVATWPNEIDLAPDAMYEEIKCNGTWIIK